MAKEKMLHDNKSEIINCLSKEPSIQRSVTTAAVSDGTEIRLRNSVTFGGYFTEQFLPFILP